MKNDLRVALTRRMIKEGLLRLLQAKTPDKIRVNELCQEAGINRATFYRHYASPREVLRELEEDFVGGIPKFSRPPRDMEEARAGIEAACEYIYHNAEVAKLLFRNRSNEDMMRGMDRIYGNFLELRSKEEPCLRVDDDTARILIALIGGGCHCLLRQWILEDIPKTPHEIAAILCEVIRWPSSADFL